MQVAITDDVALFRRGLAALLREVGVEVVGEAETGDGMLRQLGQSSPDVVILDIQMPPTYSDEGIAVAAEVRRLYPRVGILLLSAFAETAYVMQLLEKVGVDGVGYLIKDRVADIATLQDALRRVSDGESVIEPELVKRLLHRERHVRLSGLGLLTPREREVLCLMAEGRSNTGIAAILCLAVKTVDVHTGNIFAKLGLAGSDGRDHRRVLAVLEYIRDAKTV